jgi:hypothetical protein
LGVRHPFHSFAFQTLAKMMVPVLNMRNLKNINTLMVVVIVHHEEFEKQITNMMVMAIIDFEEHEKMTISIIYKCE